jgi:uroporphyrinogen decarboxylase
MTSKRERLEAAIAGDVADRPPVALWRHFPVDDQHPEELAESTVAFQEAFDFDFVKVTPASSFCLKGWGAEDEWRGADEGTRAYTRRVVANPQDWLNLERASVSEGSLGDQLDVLRMVVSRLGSETPVIQTIFSPLAQAKNLAGGERMLAHLRRFPEKVLRALKVITETTVDFIQSAQDAGIAGIFYAIQHASYHYFEADGYREVAEVLDRKILDAASSLWLNVLHLHGEDLIFELAGDYPCHVLNWHDRPSGPPLAKGAERFAGAVCGGIDRRGTMVFGDPERVRREGMETLASMGGRGVILGTGCVVPITAPLSNLRAVRDTVENCA